MIYPETLEQSYIIDMLRISLDKLIQRLERQRGSKVTLEEIHKKAGVSRNVLSRILNNPQENITVKHIDSLVQFFFYEYRKHKDQKPREEGNVITKSMRDRRQLQLLTGILLDIFPEEEEYAEFLKTFEQDPEDEFATPITDVNELWRFYGAYEKGRSEYVEDGATGFYKKKPRSKKKT